jgi:hypothetical protein
MGVGKKNYASRKDPSWMHFFLVTPTFCGFRVSAPEIMWGKCAIIIGETSVVIRIMSVVALTGNHVPEGRDKSKPGVET